jgi:hypothetical protein
MTNRAESEPRVPAGDGRDVRVDTGREGDMGDAGGNRRGAWWLLAGGAFLVVIALIGGYVILGDRDAASSPQEVFLQPVGAPGPDPFTESVAVEEVALRTSVEPTEVTNDEIVVNGNQPGLYGGTQDNASCDAAALVSFLEANPEKGRAWADALGLAPDDIRSYVAELTPLLLRTDTRVTNHGFRDGVATPLQSVLQAGTAVMVDRYGVPRVRCSCGNPLGEPAPLSSSLTSGRIDLVGTQWTGWDPNIVLVVNATTEINNFTVFDIDTELTYTLPAGSHVDQPTRTTTTTRSDDEGDDDEDQGVDDVFPTEQGVKVRTPDGDLELLAFGLPFDEVRARLGDLFGGRGSEGDPIPFGGGCANELVSWNGFWVFGAGDRFVGWSFGHPRHTLSDFARPKLKTDKGIGPETSREEFDAAYPDADESDSPKITMDFVNNLLTVVEVNLVPPRQRGVTCG